MSIEPILSPLEARDIRMAQLNGWVIIGAETGNRKDKVIPKKKWIMDIADACADANTPVFMKESLRELMGVDFVQEFPWRGEQDGD